MQVMSLFLRWRGLLWQWKMDTHPTYLVYVFFLYIVICMLSPSLGCELLESRDCLVLFNKYLLAWLFHHSMWYLAVMKNLVYVKINQNGYTLEYIGMGRFHSTAHFTLLVLCLSHPFSFPLFFSYLEISISLDDELKGTLKSTPLHFTHEKTEVERDKTICPRSHSRTRIWIEVFWFQTLHPFYGTIVPPPILNTLKRI